MKGIRKYRKLLEPVIGVLFLFASTGITVMLHSCMMGGTLCCEKPVMKFEMNDMCEIHPADSPAASLTPPRHSCCETKIAGGRNTTPGVLAKQDLPTPQREEMTGGRACSISMYAHDNIPTKYFNVTSERLSLTSVEKYVLNAAFLI